MREQLYQPTPSEEIAPKVCLQEESRLGVGILLLIQLA